MVRTGMKWSVPSGHVLTMNDSADHGTIAERRRRFETFYDETQAPVLAFVLRRTERAEDAADVVAETFLVAWRRLDELPAGAERLWIYGVARRVLANHRRGERRRLRLADQLREELAVRMPQTPPSGELAELAAAFRTLPEGDREVLMLEAWEQLSSVEIAAVLGCSRNAARIRLHRARKRLHAAMAHRTGRVQPTRPVKNPTLARGDIS